MLLRAGAAAAPAAGARVKGQASEPIPWLGIAMVAGAALAWSTAGLFPRIVQTDVFTTLFWRSLFGGLSVLVLFAAFQRGHPANGSGRFANLWRLNRAEWIMALQSSAAMVSFIAAFFYTTVADVVFIYSAFPIITLLLSAAFLKTAIRRVDLLCAGTVVLGMALIVGGQTSLHNLLGTALSLCATLMFALITMGIKRHPEAQMMKVTYAGALLAALCMLPWTSFADTSAGDLAWLWLYGFLNVAVGFGLYLVGVRRMRAVLASLVCMVEIPLAPLWVFVLFGETVSEQSLVGGAIIVLAAVVNIASHGKDARPPGS